jgi:hypothetical protein
MLVCISKEYRVGSDDLIHPYVLLVNSHDGSNVLRINANVNHEARNPDDMTTSQFRNVHRPLNNVPIKSDQVDNLLTRDSRTDDGTQTVPERHTHDEHRNPTDGLIDLMNHIKILLIVKGVVVIMSVISAVGIVEYYEVVR